VQTADELSRAAREAEQLRVTLLEARDQVLADRRWRRDRAERALAALSAGELEARGDELAAAVRELDRWDAVDQDGVDALDERAEWARRFAAELRAEARRLSRR
jgi:hypothetical protein